MVRFSCFSSSPVNRSKKVAQRSMGTLRADYQSVTQDQSIKVVKDHVKSNPMPDNYIYSYNSVNRSTSPFSLRDCWRSDGLNVKLPEDNEEIPLIGLIKKSHSLGSIMEEESGRSGDDIMDDDIDREFSFDFLNTWNFKEVLESSDNDYTDSTEIFHHQNGRKIYQNQKKNDLINSIDVPMHHESHFSIEVLKQPDRDWRLDIAEQAVDAAADSRCSPGRIPTLSRSYSVTNLRLNTTERSKNASSHGHIFRRSRSFSDLNKLNILEIELQNDKKYFDLGHAIEKSSSTSRSNLPVGHDVNRRVSCYDDTREGGPSLVRRKIVNFSNGDDALRKSEANDAKITRECKQESSCDNWDQLTSQEFSMRRVENWISQIEIHDDLIVQEQGESSTIVPKEETQILAGVDPPKPDARSNLAMEVAHNYISSLTSSSSSAQMANLGLVAIPVLSPFVSLRVLNLSGNALVHITPGCLPKGLHMLNLSKNKISTIEGLGDLSRLRVLDLNYNRIARLGHGLASCSSLKELYLAGNKISEVEGLHRLLKLKTLDLRFNKISTSKGLGQLAANYASLQAINLEGNPAQKNVGDEQLKRFLLGLLPNLVYYNKQAIQMGSKDVSDRDSRAVASPQFNRGFRVGHKTSRKGPHGSELNQLTSNHEQQVSAIAPSRKPSKGKHVRLQLPPASSKLTKLRSDKEKKSLCLNTNNAMKRS